MSWQIVKLGTLVAIKTGKLDANAADIQGLYPFFTCSREPLRINSYAFDCDAILIAGNGDLNVKHYNGKFNAYQRTYVVTSLSDEILCTRYLFHFMDKYVERLRELSIGGVIKYIKLGMLTDAEIPLPPLAEQKRIATILDVADAIRRKRQQAIQLADNFLHAVFLEMFGDPVMNPKGWAISSVTAHGSFKNGLNFGKGESGHSLRYLGVGDFKSLSTIDDIGSLGSVTLDSLPGKDYLLENGDLVFVRSNGNKELVGRCITIYPDGEPLTFSSFCIRYRIEDDSVASEYLNYLFRTPSMKQTMLKGGQGANIQNINQKILGALEFPLPPKALQEKFSKIVQTYRGSKLFLDCGFVHAESLFAAISQKAFSGKL
ncbi:type I restriction enzyme StySPI specificity protein [Alishewanella agri BL06]|uniref:Type I restriction enzyme StySPI specificity protein n=1 Tax=Alishewanella agri BL06 TaxID=1195246 RepID=I9DV51_9ALTE|nr:restriction endonuclease subunit S [Alishewanella agri]EIW90055.1 type I restriction enzyme StySPI specificity protein [Alishewanella agri BL06]